MDSESDDVDEESVVKDSELEDDFDDQNHQFAPETKDQFLSVHGVTGDIAANSATKTSISSGLPKDKIV